jgi:hypothetical protein
MAAIYETPEKKACVLDPESILDRSKRMKKTIGSLLKTPCSPEPISENDLTTLAPFNHLQRYHPGLEAFPLPEGQERRLASLPHPFRITEWKTADAVEPRIFTVRLEDASGSQSDGKAFMKVVHLLDPIALLQNEYMVPDHPLLPLGEPAWKKTMEKLHSPSNQAYVDAIANYVLGQLRYKGYTPHAAHSYGSFTGIAKTYKFRITDEYDSYKQCRWFWKGLRTHAATLEMDSPVQPSCPFDDLDAVSVANTVDLDLEPVVANDAGSVHSFNFDEEPVTSESGSGSGSGSESGSDEGDTCSSITETPDVTLQIPSMPVIIICQEAQDGTMDSLLELEEIPNLLTQGLIQEGTSEWDAMWLAWLFQVVSVLSLLQKQISFTHNDLHTNNVVWRATTEEFLYYRAGDNTVWRVPTYGRIFSLIDFGRAIFKIQDHLWLSDDHWPENDAGGQYNFGPFYTIEKPKMEPNPSFDLCRFAVSLLEGLYDDYPEKKTGTLLSQEGNWKMYETVSPLFNLLWTWTLDDDGKTVYQDKAGDEKYPGFDLYIAIAKLVHDAVPKDQLRKPVFEPFVFKGKVPTGVPVYQIGA